MLEYSKTHKHYHTLDYYLKTKYDKKVFKVSLNASFSCPNRDGTKGIGGCGFCSAKGSGDYAGDAYKPLDIQFEEVKNIMELKWPNSYYIAYFQAYSNTYGSIDKLHQTFDQFIGKENVIGMSIATRCDCINKEVIDYLKELKKNFKEFWVELGLQSSKAKTQKLLNLCYTNKDFKNAIKLLNEANIDVIVHIIDGLPYETKEDQINTIKFVNKFKAIKGIKIHILNVLDNVAIAKLYTKNKASFISEDEFIDIATTQISNLRDDIVIHRIGADVNSDNLLGPLWVRKKLTVMDKIDNYLKDNEIYQGDNY